MNCPHPLSLFKFVWFFYSSGCRYMFECIHFDATSTSTDYHSITLINFIIAVHRRKKGDSISFLHKTNIILISNDGQENEREQFICTYWNGVMLLWKCIPYRIHPMLNTIASVEQKIIVGAKNKKMHKSSYLSLKGGWLTSLRSSSCLIFVLGWPGNSFDSWKSYKKV